MTKDELRAISKKIKDLLPEEQKAVGLRFQGLQSLIKPTNKQKKPKQNTREKELWSLHPGPFGHGVTMYENELHIGNCDNYTYKRSTMVIKGNNLHMKEV